MRRLGRRARRVVGAAAIVAVVAAAYLILFGDTEVEPHLRFGLASSTIGEGEDAVGVTAEGAILAGGPPPRAELARLPISEPPKGDFLRGTLLTQAKILGAAPAPFRPCLEASRYGDTGVAVTLRSGIEIYFGDATRAAEKWAAAAALLADPEVSELDYVNVVSPRRPSTGGSGHVLPPAGEASGSGCGG
jgi:hypothetical protein